MSDFPTPSIYKTTQSNPHIKRLEKHAFNTSFSIVVKKEKGAYVYDIDGNKYADFYLNNGAVIYGHNYGTLTKFIKNGLSAGTSSGFINKFHYRLLHQIKNITKFKRLALYNDLNSAFLSLFSAFSPRSVGVNTLYLLRSLKIFSPYIDAEMIEKAALDKEYDMVILEPIDFDNDLSLYDHSACKAKTVVSFESRTAFRLKYGFLKSLDEVDIILSSNNIANGMDCALILSGNEQPCLQGENIPIYKAIAINETLKFYRRKIDYDTFALKVDASAALYQNKNIFKLKNKISLAKLLPYGIIIQSDTGFICAQHSLFDIKRLTSALDKLV